MRLGTADVLVRAKTRQYKEDLKSAKDATQKFGKNAVSSLKPVVGSFVSLAGIGGIASVTSSLVKLGADFEYQMATVSGVMRASEEDVSALTAAAKLMGETTEWSALQSGEALEFMGMAGWSAQTSIAALPDVLNLATAAGMDLGQTSDIVTDSLTAMGMGVEDLTRFSDVLIGTTTRSNTNLIMMGEALKYAAPVAAQYGYEIENVSAMLGTLANAGIKNSDAGTDLRQAMVRNMKAAKKLGTESNDLIGTLKAAKKAQWGVNEVVDNYGMIAAKSVLVLMNQIDAYDELSSELHKVNGETEELAKKKLDTLIGDFKLLKSTVEGIGLAASENVRGELRGSIQDLTHTIQDNRNTIISLFTGITWAAAKSIQAVGNLTRSVQGLAIVAASEDKSLWDWITADPEDMVRWQEEINNGIAFYKDKMVELQESLDRETNRFVFSDAESKKQFATIKVLQEKIRQTKEAINAAKRQQQATLDQIKAEKHLAAVQKEAYTDSWRLRDQGLTKIKKAEQAAELAKIKARRESFDQLYSQGIITQAIYDYQLKKIEEQRDATFAATGDELAANAQYQKALDALNAKRNKGTESTKAARQAQRQLNQAVSQYISETKEAISIASKWHQATLQSLQSFQQLNDQVEYASLGEYGRMLKSSAQEIASGTTIIDEYTQKLQEAESVIQTTGLKLQVAQQKLRSAQSGGAEASKIQDLKKQVNDLSAALQDQTNDWENLQAAQNRAITTAEQLQAAIQENAKFDALEAAYNRTGIMTTELYEHLKQEAKEEERAFIELTGNKLLAHELSVQRMKEIERGAQGDDYWTKFLYSAEDNLTSMDELVGSTINNWKSQFGSFFASAILDSDNLGDAFATMAQGMTTSIVTAIGEMIAQWLVYQATRLLVNKTAQAGAGTAMVMNAEASSLQAGINAYSSAAAIPYVGYAMAPAAMAAALAATEPMVAGIAALASSATVGMAHDGIDRVPQSGTWLLEKGERVTTEQTSQRLDQVLANVQAGLQRNQAGQTQQRSTASAAVPMTVNIHEAPGTSATVQQSDDGNLDIIIEQVEQKVSKRMDRGSGLAGYFDKRYGRRW